MICPVCSKSFNPKRSDAVVCSAACRVKLARFRRKQERASVDPDGFVFSAPAVPAECHHGYTLTRPVTIELPVELAEQLDQVQRSGRTQALWLTIKAVEVGPA